MPDSEILGNSDEDERISWHPAFFEAIQMELDDYRQDLQFISEYQLNTQPLRIDLVIIKKTKDIVIEKNIGSIFRSDNIIEYKSPDDYVSVNDYYKVYAYACLYKTLNVEDIREITLTFVGSHYPKKLAEHLEGELGYRVEERCAGIYEVAGERMPVQLIDSRKLRVEGNDWLRSLDNRLVAEELYRITEKAEREGRVERIRAYMDVIIRANRERVMEVMGMGGGALTMEKIFRDTGLIEKWKAEGKVEGKAEGEAYKAAEIAKNLLRAGFSFEKTAELSGLDVKTLHAIQ